MTEHDKTAISLLMHQLQTGHDELRQLLEEVRSGFTACKQVTGAERGQCLAAAVRELQGHIETHFAREEQGGWLEEAVIRAPHLAHRLTLLEREHTPLRQQLAKLVEFVATADCVADCTAGRLAQLQKDFDHFVAKLLHHEAEEEQVLAEGFNEELEIE